MLLQRLNEKKLIFGEEFAYVAKARTKYRDVLRVQQWAERLVQQEAQKEEAEERNVGPTSADGNESIHCSNVNFGAIDNTYGSRFAKNGGKFEGAGCRAFKELCRPHLRKFAQSAKAYAARTQLIRHMGTW